MDQALVNIYKQKFIEEKVLNNLIKTSGKYNGIVFQ